MPSQRPVVDGKTIENAYTSEWVEANYVPKETVRADYVPKADHTQRLAAKDAIVTAAKAEADTAKTALLEAQTIGASATETAAELERLRGDIVARDDNEALRIAGIVNASNEIDTGKVDLLRFAHEKTIAAMEEADRPEDAGAHFREWVKDPEGAAKHPNVGHWIKAADANAAAVAPVVVAPAKPPGAPDPNLGAAPVVGKQGEMTPEQLQSFFSSPAYLSMSSEDQAAKFKELETQLNTPNP